MNDDTAMFLRHLEMCPRPVWNDDVRRLSAEFYALDGNAAGGSLHVVLDDGNWERDHVEFCVGWARERGDVAGERFAELLLTLTDGQLLEYLGGARCWVCHSQGGDGHLKTFTDTSGECPECGAWPRSASQPPASSPPLCIAASYSGDPAAG